MKIVAYFLARDCVIVELLRDNGSLDHVLAVEPRELPIMQEEYDAPIEEGKRMTDDQ